MSYIKEMFETHPVNPSSDHAVNIECITATYSCAEACNACADACLGEKDVAQMIDCIRACTDCADVCLATRAHHFAVHAHRFQAGWRAAPRLHSGVRKLCRGVREARRPDGALPRVRGSVPALRARMRGVARGEVNLRLFVPRSRSRTTRR